MNLTHDIAVGHARALRLNYRTANPGASIPATADYVASEMVAFVRRARTAHDVDTDYGSWYGYTVVNMLTGDDK